MTWEGIKRIYCTFLRSIPQVGKFDLCNAWNSCIILTKNSLLVMPSTYIEQNKRWTFSMIALNWPHRLRHYFVTPWAILVLLAQFWNYYAIYLVYIIKMVIIWLVDLELTKNLFIFDHGWITVLFILAGKYFIMAIIFQLPGLDNTESISTNGTVLINFSVFLIFGTFCSLKLL